MEDRVTFTVTLTAAQFAALEEAQAVSNDKRIAVIRQGLKWYCKTRGIEWPNDMPPPGGDRRGNGA